MSPTARSAIHSRARDIAEDSPIGASRWLRRVLDAAASLEVLPRRGALAEEDSFVEYEVRQLIVGDYLLLYTIDDNRRKVEILWLRHGHQRARER